MKNIKRITAILLALCLVLGLPFAVSAVGTTDPSNFKLLYAMEMPDEMAKNEEDKGRTVLLYFNSKPTTPEKDIYFELLGFSADAPESLTDVTAKSARTMAINTAYGAWNNDNMIAVTFDADMDGDFSDESTFSRVLANANCDPNRWTVAVTQLDFDGQAANTKGDGKLNHWTNTLGQTMVANGRRRPVVNGSTITKGDTFFLPLTKQTDLLTLDSAVLTEDQVTVTFSESVYMETSRYGSAASLRIVDENYNVLKYDSSNTDTPYSTTSGTDLTVVLSMTNSYSASMTGTYSNPSSGKISEKSLKEHLDSANALAGSDTYRLCLSLGDGGYNKIESLGEGANNKFVDSIWSYDATTQEHTYKPLVAHNTDASRDRAWCEVMVVTYSATVNGKPCETLADALAVAEEGQTVALLKDLTADSVNVPAGVTLDLAGRTLTTALVLATGNITDSTDGNGCLVMPMNDGSEDHLLSVRADNVTLPLYDTQRNGYRFFACEVRHEQRAMEYSVMFGTMLNVNDAALTLLTDPVNAGAGLTVTLPLTVDGEEKLPLSYPFKAATLAEYAQKSLDNPTKTYAIVLTVSGFEALDCNVVLGATPKLSTSTDAFALGGEQVFTYLAQGE